MNILITNDDGYGASGIEALKKALAKEHNVFVVAPSQNRSAASVKITLEEPVTLEKVGDRDYKCSGFPADCVAAILKSDYLEEKMDLVITGINHGANLGTDIVYSGTCGAAKQASLMGVPAIAVSMSLRDPDADWFDPNNWEFDKLADFIARNVNELKKLCNPANADSTMPQSPANYLNINAFAPYLGKGVKETVPCFFDHIHNTTFENGACMMPAIYWGMNVNTASSRAYSDFDACQEGYVSVSLLLAEPGFESVDISNIKI